MAVSQKMDLYVERQYIEQMKGEDPQKFLMLFGEYFYDLYKYVARRVGTNDDAERITRLAFMDALGQVPSTPHDANYLVWLYTLARPRVWKFMEKAQSLQIGVIAGEAEDADQADLLTKTEKLFSKLSFEEREILRLKFFEEVTDGDVMSIIDTEETSIGPKIYRVLKRSHFLVFGESDDRQGVYFGELSGLLERARSLEKIDNPEMFRGVLRTELSTKISEGRSAEVEVHEVEEVVETPSTPFEIKQDVGSNDPAKIFVEAAREMQEEEKIQETEKFERSERIFDFIDRWKHVLALVPVIVFVVVGVIVISKLINFDRAIVRGENNQCEIEISYVGEFSVTQKRNINEGVSNRICGHFGSVTAMEITKIDNGLAVEVDLQEKLLQYTFVNKVGNWRVKTYERTVSSNEQPGEV